MAALGVTSGHLQWNGLKLGLVPSRCVATGVTRDMFKLEPDMRSMW